MKIRKKEVTLESKLIIKNKRKKKKELTKVISKKDFNSNKKIITKLDYYLNKKISPSKENIFDNNKVKNNIIKKVPKSRIKKRQNKFYKNPKEIKREKDPSSINSNLNIYKIINSKLQQSYSITTDSMNSYSSNISNKKSNNNCNNLFHKKKFYDYFKRSRLDSDLSNNSNKKQYFNTNKENKEKIENKCITKYLNNNKIKIKDLVSQKSIKNININNPFINNITNSSNKEFKLDSKSKDSNSNIIENKSEFNILSNKKTNIKNNNNNKKNSDEKKKNIFNEKKEKNILDSIKDKENTLNDHNDKIENNYLNINKKIYLNHDDNLIQEANTSDHFKNNVISSQINAKSEIFKKKNLNPVKKSLFSEHMNFLLNRQDEKDENNNNYLFNKNNYINSPFNNLLDSTDKKEFESKFINYDLGKTTGTSLSKDSFFLFGNKKNIEKNKISKIIDSSKMEEICLNKEEKERTIEEMEKLANEYINMSKYFENTDEF